MSTFLQLRQFSSKKKLVSFVDVQANDIITIFRTANIFKTSKCSTPINNCNKTVTFLSHEPCILLQTSIHNAAQHLRLSIITIIQPNWDCAFSHPRDLGRLISSTSDLILCRSRSQLKLAKFAAGCTKPVINVGSCRLHLLQALSNLFTMQVHFGDLTGLKIAWIGKPCTMLNTYLRIAPTLGMKLCFFCQCHHAAVSPLEYHQVESKVTECHSLAEVLDCANVIVTNSHEEIELKLTRELIEKHAHPNWIFFHCLPREESNVDDELFNSERNFVWQSIENCKWLAIGFIKYVLS